MFGRLLRCYTIYTFLRALAPNLICQAQNSLCVQILHSPILAALLHGSRAPVGRQPNFVAFSRRRHFYSAGRPSRWASAHILVAFSVFHYSFCLFGSMRQIKLATRQLLGPRKYLLSYRIASQYNAQNNGRHNLYAVEFTQPYGCRKFVQLIAGLADLNPADFNH